MRKTTRDYDLNILEEGRDRAPSRGRRLHRAALLEAVYNFSKDSYLEKMRVQLLDALKRGDIRKMYDIREKIREYAASSTFRTEIARKINRVAGEKEANIFYARR